MKKKLIALFLLVSLGLLGVSPNAMAGQTGFGGVTIDPSTDASNSSSTKVLIVKNTSGTEIFSITAGAVLSFATGAITVSSATITTATVTTLTATTLTATNGTVSSTLTVGVPANTSPGNTQYVLIGPQYLVLYTSSAVLRPASGATPGAVIAINNATGLADCGVAGSGSSFSVCVSDGTNWRPLTFKTA